MNTKRIIASAALGAVTLAIGVPAAASAQVSSDHVHVIDGAHQYQYGPVLGLHDPASASLVSTSSADWRPAALEGLAAAGAIVIVGTVVIRRGHVTR